MPNFFQTTPGVANLGFSFGFSLGQGQSFRTLPLPNLQLALYSLVIRDPFYNIVAGYTFPISPSNIRKEINALTNYYDTQGPPYTQGVTRVVDVYGNSPVTYVIEGTTGWKLHSTDGYGLTGLQSIQALESVLQQFATLNETVISGQQQTNLYSLEFYDYFRGEFWQVVPCGPQILRQSRTRPLFVDYLFRLAGVQNLTSPLVLIDALATLLTTFPAQIGASLGLFGSAIISNYATTTFELNV